MPDQQYDDCDYWNASRNRCLHIYKDDELLASFPRDIPVSPDQNHSRPFLESLGEQQRDGTRRHVLYPLPDTVFVCTMPERQARLPRARPLRPRVTLGTQTPQ